MKPSTLIQIVSSLFKPKIFLIKKLELYTISDKDPYQGNCFIFVRECQRNQNQNFSMNSG